NIAVVSILDSVMQELGVGVIAKTHINDFRSMVRCPDDALRHRISTAGAGRIQNFDGHDLVIPTHSGDAEIVVDDGADRSGHMGAVSHIVLRLLVGIYHIEAADELIPQILMIQVYPGIDHAYDDVVGASAY